MLHHDPRLANYSTISHLYWSWYSFCVKSIPSCQTHQNQCLCLKRLFRFISLFLLFLSLWLVVHISGGMVLVGLAANALTGRVLGGLNCDWHYIGGWWEVWITLSWHLPLWHNVVDGCDREKSEVSTHSMAKLNNKCFIKFKLALLCMCQYILLSYIIHYVFLHGCVTYFTKTNLNTWFFCSPHCCCHK